MPFGSSYSRTKSFAAGGNYAPADWNSIQDDLGDMLQLNNVATGVSDGTITRRAYDEVLGDLSTFSTSFAEPSGGGSGPSVTIKVPAGGFALVFASAYLRPVGSAAAPSVGLRVTSGGGIDYTKGILGGMSQSSGDDRQWLTIPGPLPAAGPAAPAVVGCLGAHNFGGFLLVPYLSGDSTFKLKYATSNGAVGCVFHDSKIMAIAGGI